MEEKKLLLLEDDSPLARSIARSISIYRPNYKIARVGHPSEARELLYGKHYIPDFILSDNDMGPGELGSHFVVDLRDSGYKGRIILATGNLTDDLRSSLETHDILCLNKPFRHARTPDGREMGILPEAIVMYFETGERFTEVYDEPAGF